MNIRNFWQRVKAFLMSEESGFVIQTTADKLTPIITSLPEGRRPEPPMQSNPRWDGTPRTECPLKSHHIFQWDRDGKIGSPFVHDADEKHFIIRIKTLQLLHVPEHDLITLCVLRDLVTEQDIYFIDPKALEERKAKTHPYNYAHLLVPSMQEQTLQEKSE